MASANHLAQAIRQHLDAGNQALLFLNQTWLRANTDMQSVWSHRRLRTLRCALNSACPESGDALPPLWPTIAVLCSSSARNAEKSVRPLGEGTERLEDTLRAQIPGMPSSAVSTVTVRSSKAPWTKLLQSAAEGRANILVGTQMLSKGHHFPKLTMVGIVNADQGLFGTDFRSSERLAQSIVQVAGRAGREAYQGEVLIQTAFPENPFWATSHRRRLPATLRRGV